MDKITYNVVQPRQSKDDKTHWFKLGFAIKDGHKFSLKLDALPLPNEKGDVWLQLYERMDDKK